MVYSIEQINAINDSVEKDERIPQLEKLERLEKIFPSLELLSNDELTVRSKNNYAVILYNMGEANKAKEIALDVYKLARNKNLYELHMRSCNFLGNISSGEGHYALAIDYYHQALKIVQEHLENLNIRSNIINNIGTIYANLKMYKLAVDYYEEALELSEKEHNTKSTFLVLYNLADAYYEIGEEDLSFKSLLKAEQLLENNKFSDTYVGLIRLQRSKHHRNFKEYNLAQRYLYEAMELLEAEADYLGLAEAQLEKSKLEYDMEAFREAYKSAFSAYNDALEMKDHVFMRKCLVNICKVLEQMNDTPKLVAFYKDLAALDEKIFYNMHEMSIYQIKEKSNVELEESRYAYAERLLNNMRFIHEVSQDISKELDYDSLINLIIEKLIGFMSFDSLVIGLYNQETREIYNRIVFHRGEITKSFNVSVDNKSSLAAWTIRHRQEVYTGLCSHLNLEDFEALKINFPELEVPYETVFYMPLYNENRIIGVFSLQKFERDGFDHYALEMIRAISSYIGVAITNALKSEKMKMLNLELEEVSRKDSLSGLNNRKALNDDLIEIIKTLKVGDQISVIMCDIDYFKQYNDTYGHIEGDQVIREVSQQIDVNTRRYSPYAYRYGGDEFLVILPQLQSELVQKIGASILDGITNKSIPHQDIGIDDKVTISMGIAHFTIKDNNLTEDLLLKDADFSLYEAKRRGRNQFKMTYFEI